MLSRLIWNTSVHTQGQSYTGILYRYLTTLLFFFSRTNFDLVLWSTYLSPRWSRGRGGRLRGRWRWERRRKCDWEDRPRSVSTESHQTLEGRCRLLSPPAGKGRERDTYVSVPVSWTTFGCFKALPCFRQSVLFPRYQGTARVRSREIY